MGILRKVLRAVLLGTFLFIPIFLSAQTQLITQIDTTRGFVGDLIHLTLTAKHPANATVQFPDSLKNLGDFSVRKFDADNSKKLSRASYTLAVYDTGNDVIPSLPVQIFSADTNQKPLTFHSDSIRVSIVSLVPPDAKDLKDIKPLMDIPGQFPWLWILWAVVLAILLGIFIWWWNKRRNREAVPQMTPQERRETAHERALKRLKEIKYAHYPESGAMKQHFSEISETIRAYFEDRYFIPALEMTSAEVIQALPAQNLPPQISQIITELLQLSDLVKFAKYKPQVEEAAETLQHAFHIVESTKLEPLMESGTAENTEITEQEDERVLVESKGESP